MCVLNIDHLTQTIGKKRTAGFVVLPYVQGMFEKITLLRREHIKVAYKPIKSVRSIFKKPKDKVEKDKNTGIDLIEKWPPI